MSYYIQCQFERRDKNSSALTQTTAWVEHRTDLVEGNFVRFKQDGDTLPELWQIKTVGKNRRDAKDVKQAERGYLHQRKMSDIPRSSKRAKVMD